MDSEHQPDSTKPVVQRRSRAILILLVPALVMGALLLLIFRPQHQLETIWRSDEISYNPRAILMASPGNGVLMLSGQHIRAWDDAGRQLWDREMGNGWDDCRWVYSDTAGLLVFNNGNILRCLNINDGSTNWQSSLEGGVQTTRRKSRLDCSPSGEFIALANSDKVFLLDDEGKLLHSMDHLTLQGELHDLFVEDNGRLTTCMKQNGAMGTVYNYYREGEEGYGQVQPLIPGRINRAMQLDNGNYYGFARDASGHDQLVQLCTPSGALLYSDREESMVHTGRGKGQWLAWIASGATHGNEYGIDSSIRLLGMENMAVQSYQTGSYHASLIYDIADDGALLLEGKPGADSSIQKSRRNLLKSMRINHSSNPTIAELIAPRQARDWNSLLYLQPDGKQALYTCSDDVLIRHLYRNSRDRQEFGTVYGFEVELDKQGEPIGSGMMRLVCMEIPTAKQ